MNERVRKSIEETIAGMDQSKKPLTEERIREIIREELKAQELNMFNRFLILLKSAKNAATGH